MLRALNAGGSSSYITRGSGKRTGADKSGAFRGQASSSAVPSPSGDPRTRSHTLARITLFSGLSVGASFAGGPSSRAQAAKDLQMSLGAFTPEAGLLFEGTVDAAGNTSLRLPIGDAIDMNGVKRSVTDGLRFELGGIPFSFQPIKVTADPFALRGELWFAHVGAEQTEFRGGWMVENTFEAGWDQRGTVDADNTHNSYNDKWNYVLPPNGGGPRIETTFRASYPLDDAARADQAADREAGRVLPPQASAWHGNWLLRAISGGTSVFAQDVIGVEGRIHADGAIRPYNRTMVGINKSIPLGPSIGGIDLRMGVEYRLDPRGGEVGKYVEASYRIQF